MVCHAVLSRRRGDNHSFSLRRKLQIFVRITLGAYGSYTFCGAALTLFVEQRSSYFYFFAFTLTLHLQSAQQKMDPRSDSGRESVSSQWWEGVDKKSFVNFVLLSLGGRRQRKADNQ